MISQQARALAAVINRLVADSPLSQREIARQLVPVRQHSTLSQWRNGQRVPSATDMNDLLNVLEVSDAERVRVMQVHRDVHKSQPDYHAAAQAILTSVNLPASQVRTVINALAAYCEPTRDLCASPLTPQDLRMLAAVLAG